MTKCLLLLPTLYNACTVAPYHVTKWFIPVWSEQTSEEAACHLQIVDQVINFRDVCDLLELKYLSSLYIDWHDDAVNSPSWFPDMLAKEEWKKVAQKLVSLEVVVPAIYYNAHYDLPTKDAELLLTYCVQLTCLTLKGAGILEHIDLSTILANGKCLKSCVLKYCMAKVGSNENYPTSMGLQSLTIVGGEVLCIDDLPKIVVEKMPLLVSHIKRYSSPGFHLLLCNIHFRRN